MNERSKLDYFVVAVGLAVTLAGVTFYLTDEKRFGAIVLLLTGVGSSVLATGITNLIANARLLPLPLHSVLEALSERTKLVRRNHVLTLTFTMQGNDVRVTKKHEFALFNPGRTLTKNISMYTDTVSWRHETRGGFKRIQEPNGNQLTGAALTPAVSTIKNGKVYFRKRYRFPSREDAFYQGEKTVKHRVTVTAE